MSRSQIYQWRAALREGRLGEAGDEIVGFVPVEMPLAPSGRPPGMDNFAAVSTNLAPFTPPAALRTL